MRKESVCAIRTTMRLLHFGIRPVRRRDLLPRPLIPRDISRRLVIEEATVYEGHVGTRTLNSNETIRKPLEKARRSNAGRRAQPLATTQLGTTRGWNTGWRDTAWRTSRGLEPPFVGNSPRITLTWVLLKGSHDGVGFRKFYKTPCDVEKDATYIEVGLYLYPGGCFIL